jgi:murein DD-endopeptidase MepM/ murein hydrolase activator NlpD
MRQAAHHIWSSLFLLLLGANVKPLCLAQNPVVMLSPALVENGSPELIRIEGVSLAATRVDGEWMDRRFAFFRGPNRQSWVALVGVDVEAKPGLSTLKISIRLAVETSYIETPVRIHPASYATETLTVEPRFVSPGPEDLKEIEADSKLKAQVFATSSPQRLWYGSFVAPVKAQATASFGTRRTFNGKLASIHKGTDFRAAAGTLVRAANSGTVVLAQPLYYEGNCVIIDHGLGLMSISMHLSRIDVVTGQQISRGQQLGLSGATGRVTGPHLHWAIRWQGAYLDPAKLLRLNLENLR